MNYSWHIGKYISIISDFGKRMEDCDAMGFAKYHGKKIMKLTAI